MQSLWLLRIFCFFWQLGLKPVRYPNRFYFPRAKNFKIFTIDASIILRLKNLFFGLEEKMMEVNDENFNKEVKN
jgi:hypothetical protein